MFAMGYIERQQEIRAEHFTRFAANAEAHGLPDLADAIRQQAAGAIATAGDPFTVARYAAEVFTRWDTTGRAGSIRLTPPNFDNTVRPDAVSTIAPDEQVLVLFRGSLHLDTSYNPVKSRRNDRVTSTDVPDVQLRQTRLGMTTILFAEDPATLAARPVGRQTTVPRTP